MGAHSLQISRPRCVCLPHSPPQHSVVLSLVCSSTPSHARAASTLQVPSALSTVWLPLRLAVTARSTSLVYQLLTTAARPLKHCPGGWLTLPRRLEQHPSFFSSGFRNHVEGNWRDCTVLFTTDFPTLIIYNLRATQSITYSFLLASLKD